MVGDTYCEIFATSSGLTESTDGTFRRATATNLVGQVGNVSQAVPVGVGAVLTVFMLLIVVALGSPFREGTGRLSPELIEQRTASM